MFKKGSFYLFLLVLCMFVLSCNNASNSAGEDGKNGKDGVSIVWKGSFSSADQIENPEYLWAYFNTEDGCSYIYDGEKWTLLAEGKKPDDILDGFEVFLVEYQTDNGTVIQPFYCTNGFRLTSKKLPVLTKEHYSFDGWYDGDIKVSENYRITKSTTLTAKWIVNKCKITYVCDDESITVSGPVFVDYGTVLDSSYFPDLIEDQTPNYINWHWQGNNENVGSGYIVLQDVIFKYTGFYITDLIEWGRFYTQKRTDDSNVCTDVYGEISFPMGYPSNVTVQIGVISVVSLGSYFIKWMDVSPVQVQENKYGFTYEISRGDLIDGVLSDRVAFRIQIDGNSYYFECDNDGSAPFFADVVEHLVIVQEDDFRFFAPLYRK